MWVDVCLIQGVDPFLSEIVSGADSVKLFEPHKGLRHPITILCVYKDSEFHFTVFIELT